MWVVGQIPFNNFDEIHPRRQANERGMSNFQTFLLVSTRPHDSRPREFLRSVPINSNRMSPLESGNLSCCRASAIILSARNIFHTSENRSTSIFIRRKMSNFAKYTNFGTCYYSASFFLLFCERERKRYSEKVECVEHFSIQ